jgi:hypothetical protein
MRISFSASAAGAPTGLIAQMAIIAEKPRLEILVIVVILRGVIRSSGSVN